MCARCDCEFRLSNAKDLVGEGSAVGLRLCQAEETMYAEEGRFLGKSPAGTVMVVCQVKFVCEFRGRRRTDAHPLEFILDHNVFDY